MNVLSRCPACAGPGRPWATVRDRHYGNPGTWPIAECKSCAARYLDPMPSPEELGAFYPDDYYSHQSITTTSASLKSRVRSVVLPIRTGEPDLRSPGRVLDLGCGSGWMLERYREAGWDVVGVEYSASACDAGRSKGLTMHCGSLTDAALPAASFDYIRSNHSFEHLTNPVETLAEISRLLEPGGTLFLGVPDTMGLTARLFGAEWFYVGAPVHTINYNRLNLAALLDRAGFDVQRVRANSNHGGTVGSLQSWIAAKLGRNANLSAGPVTWAPLIIVGFWSARLLDAFNLGDCVEIIATKRTRTP